MPTITKIFDLPEPETEAQVRARELLTFANQLQDLLYRHYDKLYKGLWNSDVPPDEIITAMGSNAVPFFLKASAFTEFLATHCNVEFAPDEIGSKLPLQFNADGTITVVDTDEE